MRFNSLSFPFPLVLAFPALVLTSCVESDSAYTLNKDGSGKVVHQIKFRKTAGDWTDEEPARTFALGFVRGTEGVAAWDDVHYRMADGGKAVEFRGTAYFRDINQVSLGSFLKDGEIQQLPIPLVRSQKKDGKHQIALKDPPATKTKTKMEVTVNGAPVPSDEKSDDAPDEGLGALDSLMTASFAMSGDFKTSIRVNGKVVETNGFEAGEPGDAVTFRYHGDAGGKEGKQQLEKRFKEEFGEEPTKEAFDELFAGGIFENDKLMKLVTGAAPPITASFEIADDAFPYDVEVADADLKLTKEEAAGWKKLESLEE